MEEHEDQPRRGVSRLDIAVVALIGVFALGGFVFVFWSLSNGFSFHTG